MKPSNIIFSVDKLPITLPGCYGNTESETPGLDRLATLTCLFDRVYAEDADPHRTLRKMWHSLDLASFPAGRFLLTDDPMLGTDSFFDDALCMANSSEPQTFSDLLEMAEHVAAEIPDALLWCHAAEPDLPVLDEWISQHDIAALLTVRGLAVRKVEDAGATQADIRRNMLHHQEIQLAWWIRFDAQEYCGARCRNLLSACDLGKILRAERPGKVRRETVFVKDTPRWAVATDEWFLTGDDRLDAEKEYPGELYLKPDDWWEQNDVAGRCPEEMKNFQRLRDENSHSG